MGFLQIGDYCKILKSAAVQAFDRLTNSRFSR